MHDPHREHPHPPRPRPTDVGLTNNELDEVCEGDFGLRLELGGNLYEKRKTVRVPRRKSGALGVCLQEQGEGGVLQ